MKTKKSPLDGYAESGLVMKFWLKVQADFFDQAVSLIRVVRTLNTAWRHLHILHFTLKDHPH